MNGDVLIVERPVRRSDSIAALAAALSKAQGEIAGASKDKTNPHFKQKYADLASVWDACRAPLSKNGLAVMQPASASGPNVTVTTILAHSSGEWIEGELTMTAQQNTPQGIGSCLTYARRYALASMVGVAPEDDDANEATRPQNGQAQNSQVAAIQKDAASPDGYTKFVATLMVAAGKGTPALMKAFNEGLLELRTYLTRSDNATWETLKSTAALAVKSAKPEAVSA